MALLLVLAVGFSCVEDDEFDTPDTSVEEPTINGTVIDVDAVLGILAQAELDGDSDFTFEQDSDNVMVGYVVSSDEGGNFFEELIIQDAAANPTAGIKLLIDVNPLFTKYEIGRKIYVNLAGLTVATTNGVAGLGIGGGDFIEKIPAPQEDAVIIRSAEVAEVTPLEVAVADLSDAYENLFVRLSDVQFNRNDVLGENPLTFAAEDGDEFDGERFLEACAGGGVIVSTSTFADFKGLTLPVGRGTLDGILSRDFFDDFNVINLNEPGDIDFGDESTRCDPDFTACTTPSGGGTAFFSENFEGISDLSELVTAGWTLQNTSGGSTEWVLGNFSGNQYAQITAFSSGEENIESWLITPGIDMDAQTAEELIFEVQANFDNGTVLAVLFSENFTGDAAAADWNLLDATIPVGPSSDFGNFETVGPVNISCLEGTIHIGFLYTGSESGQSTRYHVDDVEITGM
ncbi:MAG: DUF5689 domain-containing protein [Gilvibacter sp.]